jgi:hypothetical protein
MVQAEVDLAAAVIAAKEAVSGLDEPMKTEGFKILLVKIIERAEMGGHPKGGQAEALIKEKKRIKGSEKRKSGQTVFRPSTLKLSVEELRSLKDYSERFDLGGSEQIAFVLANFVREHTDLEYATAPDIAYLYRQLVSQKVDVAPVNDLADWNRALGWLAVPSRKKEWLEKSGEGYVVSNSGLLRFHEMEKQTEVADKPS